MIHFYDERWNDAEDDCTFDALFFISYLTYLTKGE